MTDFDLENGAVVAAVQALAGMVTPSLRSLALDISPDTSRYRVNAAIGPGDPLQRSLHLEMAAELEEYLERSLTVELAVWVGEDWNPIRVASSSRCTSTEDWLPMSDAPGQARVDRAAVDHRQVPRRHHDSS